MKKLLIFASIGILGALVLLRGLQSKQAVYHFVESDEGKNFGAFPPEIPEDQFDEMFV